jgi:iron(III) transport system substrate-binding protein
MAAYRVLHGEEALDRLLASLHAGEPRLLPSDDAVVEAVARGEVDWGLVDHSALRRQAAAATAGGAAAVAGFFMPAGDGSGFVDVAGIGVLSDDPRALELVRFLLGEEAQDWFAEQTHEYPLARGTPPAPELPPLSELRTPRLDFADVAAVLGETSRAVRRHGLAS